MEKRNIFDTISEKEVAACGKHPIISTAATTVATTAAIATAKGPLGKAGGAIKGAAGSIFSGSKGAVSDAAEAAPAGLVDAAFKGGGSEETAGMAANGLLTIAKWAVSLIRK